MRLIRRIAALWALAAVGAAANAQGKGDDPASTFLVINNTSLSLRCAWRASGIKVPWSAWFAIPSGANWQIQAGGNIVFQCAPPVRQTIYFMQPGARYSLLRIADGSVDLIHVTKG